MDLKNAREKASSETSSDDSDLGDWLDVEPDEEAVVVISLFDSETFQTAADMIAHCKNQHDFDLTAAIRRLNLDFLGAAKLVNFVRSRVRDHQTLPRTIALKDFDDDEYLKPVLANDALLFSLDEILEADESNDGVGGAVDEPGASTRELSVRNRELEDELEAVRSHFANYRLAVEETLDRRWGDGEESSQPAEAPKKDTSDYYFESYAAHEIHETMLKDAIRTDAYRDFIYENKHLFKGKVVLDIGCGTGILSMFCAKAGAKQVIAVDKSEIIDKAREIIFNNNLSETITCLRGAIEEVVLPVDQVDIIVSEWMGYCLLYEAMLPSVLYARDKYLKPDGILAPAFVSLWIAPVSDSTYVSDHISYWRDVYGFDMKAMQEGIHDEVRIDVLPKTSLCGEAFPFKVLDLRFCQPKDLVFSTQWKSVLSRNIDELDGFLMWFDTFFATSSEGTLPAPHTTTHDWTKQGRGNISFTTGPFGTETHWNQGLLLSSPSNVISNLSEGSNVSGEVTFSIPEDNKRALTIETSWTATGSEKRTQSWRLK